MRVFTTDPSWARNRNLMGGAILALGWAGSGLGVSATAADLSSRDAGGGDTLQEVVVTGHYEFLGADTSGTTNLPLPIEKVPQSISLVTGDFLKAADLKTLGEIAEYTPGALNVGNQEGFGTIIKLRGFLAAQSLDGLNIGVFGGTAYEPDYAVVDRLEIVKGPSSVVYGISSAGGLVNFVTKSATAETPDYVSLQVGNWKNFRVEGQVAGALDPSQSLRGIAVVVRDQGDSFMNSIRHATTVVYGGLNWSGSDALSAYLHGGFEEHIRTAFDGIPTEADGSAAPLPRSFFIGASDMELYTDVFHAEADVTWHVNDMLDLSLKGNVRRVRSHGNAPYSFGLDESGNVGIAIQQFEDAEANDYGVGFSATYHLDSLGLHNSFVSVAALYQVDCSCIIGGQGVFTGAYATDFGPNVGTVNLFSGEAAIQAAFNSATIAPPSDFNDVWAKTLTISAQSFTQVVDHLSVLVGASYSDPKISSSLNGVNENFDPGNQMSYRAGLVGEVARGANAYLSFSQSFNPQTSIDINGNVLPPITSTQYEAGFKYRVAGNRLLLSAAVFQIKQKNQGEFFTQIDGFDRYEPIGELTHKGVELQALGSVSREWQVNFGYTYLDPKVSQNSDPTTVGKTELFLPRQTASIFSTYNFDGGALSGFSIGGGIRYVGSEQTAFDGSSQAIASYTVADASLGYSLQDWHVQLNLHNLGNKRYLINNYDTTFYGNVVGDPFHVALTLRRNF